MSDLSEDFRILDEKNKKEKAERIARFYEKVMPRIKSLVKEYEDCLVLEEKASGNHYRIKNLDTGKFIDFWHTRAMQRIDKSVCGMGYKEDNLLSEIKKLVFE